MDKETLFLPSNEFPLSEFDCILVLKGPKEQFEIKYSPGHLKHNLIWENYIGKKRICRYEHSVTKQFYHSLTTIVKQVTSVRAVIILKRVTKIVK